MFVYHVIFLSLSEDAEDRWKMTLSWEWGLYLHSSCLILDFAIQGMVLSMADVCFGFLIIKVHMVMQAKVNYWRDKNLEHIFLTGILTVFSWIPLNAYCSHIIHVGHSGASISVIISLCFVCWAGISHSEEVLWSHGISAALVRWKTDGFLSGQHCF